MNKVIFYLSLFIFMLAGCVTQQESVVKEDSKKLKNCALIDSDFALDDLRAITLLLPKYDYTLLVATEGLSRPMYGTKIGETLLSQLIGHYNGDIFQGESPVRSTAYSWLSEKRDVYEQMNSYLPMRLPASQKRSVGNEEFRQQVDSCHKITLFLLSPYSSFQIYKNIIADKVSETFSYGTYPSPRNKDLGFNCEYDKESCFKLGRDIQKFNMSFFRLPQKYKYNLTAADLNALQNTDPEKLIKDIHFANSTSWNQVEAQMADDMVALYMYAPQFFQKKGRQYFLKLNPEQFRQQWVKTFKIAAATTVASKN